jgi:hypothetical protein
VKDSSNDLSPEDVKKRVDDYKGNGVTDELYSFGVMLLNEIGQRAVQIESKAATTLGWATGILAFLWTQGQGVGALHKVVTLSAMAFALIAIILSFIALRVRGGWKGASDMDWFQESALTEDGDALKRFHIRSIHEARQAQKQITGTKANCVFWGQGFLLLAGVLMALGILFSAFPSFATSLERVWASIGLT